MAASISIPRSTAVQQARERAQTIPWYLWASTLAVTSSMIGVQWDISWHRSIGRDSFWTPAHIAIQLCGVIAGITCGYLILKTTFTNSALRAASVNVLGFRAPLGAFIAAWGGFTMITSAPFDDWWHSAYGLDVKILSPPHVVLAIGVMAVEIGTLVLIAAQMNRAADSLRRRLTMLFLYVAAIVLVGRLVLVLEFSTRIFQHSGIFYRVVCLSVPIVLAAAWRATRLRWATTVVCAFYSAIMLAQLWILPLFPAQPKLGPVYHEVTQFIPLGFPFLLIVPAIVLDSLWKKAADWNKWLLAVVSGVLFLAVFAAVQWPFADFLQSPAARNAFFGSHYLDYYQGPQTFSARYLFLPVEKTAARFWGEIGLAAICSIATMRIGFAAGDWLKRVRR